ncbi:cache domain-containing protein, partial [Sulfurimonas sp.]|uniref:cache domain-containing protein n=1 Tax=Sulfurimonas sp. TaxID=2022749 RepID=UPI0025F04BEE
MRTKTKNLIRIIKLAPLFVILFTCLLTTALMYQEQEKEFKNEEIFSQTQYIENEKDRIYHITNDVHNYVKSEKQRSQKNLKKDLKLRINNIHKMATNIYNKNKDTLTKKQIIKLIKNAIETIRFQEGKGYFSIHTMQGINILHPTNHKFEGTSVFNRQDIKGNYPVQEAIKIAKTKGEGFFQWYYSKPNDKSKEFKKIGIVKKFEPYNLIITTAIYIDDFEKNLQKDILSIIIMVPFFKTSKTSFLISPLYDTSGNSFCLLGS